MRKWILALGLIALLVFPGLAFAQNELTIDSLEVNLWPEYDRPQVLVIQYILLATETTFPVTVDLRIPAVAQAPHVVAVGPSLQLVSDQGVQFETRRVGEWLIVSVIAAGPAIQLEYYDPAIKRDGDLRAYQYEWLSDYDVEAFEVAVQRPFDATHLRISPALQDDGVYQNQLQYYRSVLDPIRAGTSFHLDLSYQKPTNTLSVSRLQVEPVEVNEDTPGRISLNNYVPYMLAGVGVLMLAGGIIYYWQAGGVKAAARSRRRRRPAAVDGEEEHRTGVYCAQCGTRAKAGDRFCRVCGARLRGQG
jgi:hypothetical protein